MEDSGLRKASHIGLWIGLVSVIVFLAWSAVNKPSQDNTYQKGSTDASRAVNRGWFSPDLFEFSCDYIKPNGQPLKPGDKK